jgi:hypothetical protein
VEECVAGQEESLGALAGKCGKSRIDFADRGGFDDLNLQADGGGCFANIPQYGFGVYNIRRIDEHANTNGLGHQLMQERQ